MFTHLGVIYQSRNSKHSSYKVMKNYPFNVPIKDEMYAHSLRLKIKYKNET